MESTTTNFQQHQQQQQLQDYFVVGSSPLNNPSGYGVSSSLEWNPNFLSTRRTPSNSSTLNNKPYESSNEFPEASGETTASNLSYPTSCNQQLPKIEEDMLSSFPSFSALMNQTTIPTASMENTASINPACTWFNGFALGAHYSPLDHKEHHQSISYNSNYTTNNNNYWSSSMHGFGNASLLINQMGGLVSSPHSTTTSVSSSPRLGLNLQASDFLAHNPSLAGVGEEVISPPGKILSNEVSALMNGVTGTKRAAGSCNRSSDHQPKSSTSNNTAAANKKSQLKVSCPPFKVRKEKLGDRIAALHQLVSPFGKTDTASVLTEAIGYIQFLQDQIHTLCMPQAKPSRNKPCRPFHMGANISTEDEGKELEERIDLRRRGLCLVPSSWTSYITPDHLDGSNLTYF